MNGVRRDIVAHQALTREQGSLGIPGGYEFYFYKPGTSGGLATTQAVSRLQEAIWKVRNPCGGF
jgi:hypothetical protein